ncbi:hypothetical protein SLEP1_g38763 [Rubroshorea leprosula]|uniref:non-specific serine/threonine protein kinase n=1 Tax=Rubroshorea leprosula TaxID=152421 RepID=A0AAV5KYF3_9ROSI|nr:hypothetical protein SLEP1_g38763 [Rubroshorea leprosula]
MAEPRRNDLGIPSGLNRIKTRPVSTKSEESNESSSSKPPLKQQNQKTVPPGHGKMLGLSKEVERKGNKISRWFTSYISKNSNDVSSVENGSSEVKMHEKEETTRIKVGSNGNLQNGKQSSADVVSGGKASKTLKSFSHELGPKGGIQSAHPRVHSYGDLKELLGSLHSSFDAAKEVVNAELSSFCRDVMDVMGVIESSSLEGHKMAQDLLVLAQQCIEMISSQFRAKCETIVQDLTEKRQCCQTGLVKWLFTRMLFILTRCTRLLLFQKEKEPIDEKSLNKFKKCLESVPAVESSWVPNREISKSGSSNTFYQRASRPILQGKNKESSFLEPTWPAEQIDATCTTDSIITREKSLPNRSQLDSVSQEQQFHQADGNLIGKSANSSTCSSLHEHKQTLDASLVESERTLDESGSVICRICEEAVPITHLESHSYICAYADKCALNCIDVDERLVKLAEILEQIIESRNLSSQPSIGSPENLRLQNSNSTVILDGYSPKISEWRNKGVEGMFEDIHEMDTACIDDSHPTSIDFKVHLGMRLGNYGASSSTGSITSVSSMNTPKAGHFDYFWLERNNPSEQEDMQQMIDLADIARCVASTDLTKEGSHEFLLACMQDLLDILQHSKLRALVIDTFGGRIEKLLREKYILACEVMDVKGSASYSEQKENCRLLSDNASQSSTMSTALHRERTSIDDFEILKPISKGAFGKVFLARKRTTGDLFAIKVLKKLDMIRKNDIERILAERYILITVRNPFVVRFFYSFTCRDNLYLVMEYLNGGDLYSLLRKVGCLEEEVARTYIAELVLALEYLHSLGIVHRDLKPDNILIAHDGHIKLTDFGLSKIGLINNTIELSGPKVSGAGSADANNLQAQQTEDRSRHSAVGTPDYLAPEILLGTEHGYAADWWSVGIILFEFITGIPPFTAERPELIFDNILSRQIPWPSVPDDMSYEAQDLINRFLIHDPNERLGANGSAEVKAHAFFEGVNWDSLAMQKAVFVPNPDSADDTSYFVSRFNHISGIPEDHNGSYSNSDACTSDSNSEVENDGCGDLAVFDSSPLNLSLINFSFKNLSQLASINHDVLLQTGKDSAKCSPSRGLGT